MPLDHYVSQVHLKNFYAPALDKRQMYAFRKSKLDTFPCKSKDVCRIEEGSTNPYLEEPRLLEEFLLRIEPYYNRACDALSNGQFGGEDILVIAGFVAFVVNCTPTATRLGASHFKAMAELELELLEQMGELPRPPQELGEASVSDLVKLGKLEVATDPKFPHAMGVSNLITLTEAFASFRWDIICNNRADQLPFFTSDFPVAIDEHGAPLVRLVPLRPSLAIRIIPAIRRPDEPDDLRDFRYRMIEATPADVRHINRRTVQCADEFVFSPISSKKVSALVAKYAKFRLESVNTSAQKGNKNFFSSTMQIIEA